MEKPPPATTATPQAVSADQWKGLLAGVRPTAADTTLKATLRQSAAGGSGSFLGLAMDGNRYWIKTLNNGQGEKVPVTEQIVGRVGRLLLGAPTCVVSTVNITSDFVGWEFRPNRRLEAGIAHGSLHVEEVVETKALDRHSDDDNPRRHAFALAMYDWCWGGDVQGLIALREENRFYSHDHGWFLPPEGASWTVAELTSNVDTPREYPMLAHQITPTIAEALAVVLENVTRTGIRDALGGIPAAWPATDEELECVGFFLEKRAPAVAARIRARFK